MSQETTLININTRTVSAELQSAINEEWALSIRLNERTKKTLSSYRERATRYLKWCVHANRVAVPAETDTVVAYFKHIARNTRKVETLRAYIKIIQWLHRTAGLIDYATPPIIWRMIKGRQRTGFAAPPKASKPITYEVICDLMEKTDHYDYKRAAALLGLMVQYDTATRASEVVELRYDKIKWREDGSGTVRVEKAKNDPTRKGSTRYLSRTTMGYITRFRNIFEMHGKYIVPNKLGDNPVGVKTYLGRTKSLLVEFGYADCSSHGARIGWCHDAVNAEIDPLKATKYVGWQDMSQFLYYTRELSAESVGVELANHYAR